MGRILSVRLSAVTYSEDDVLRTWPHLCDMAWPGKGELTPNAWRLTASLFEPPVQPEAVRHGVKELVHDLLEEYWFGSWNAGLKSRFEKDMEALKNASASLDKALGDWQPRAANTATDDIEELLDTLEKLAIIKG